MILGLLGLSKDGTFTTLVSDEVAKQFDDDDNVLSSTLVDVCDNANIDLIYKMDESILSYDNSLPNADGYDNYQNLKYNRYYSWFCVERQSLSSPDLYSFCCPS